MIAQAVEVLGDDYVDIMMRAYDENWIDFARNKGKRSGAFCSTPADTHPYIMLSYSGLLSDAYTLIHELGHAGHFHYVYQEQVLTAGRPSLYLIEAPSTFNELLLSDYLRKDADSPRKERSIIAKIILRHTSTILSHTYWKQTSSEKCMSESMRVKDSMLMC